MQDQETAIASDSWLAAARRNLTTRPPSPASYRKICPASGLSGSSLFNVNIARSPDLESSGTSIHRPRLNKFRLVSIAALS